MHTYVFTISAFAPRTTIASGLVINVRAENEVVALQIVEEWCEDNDYKMNLFATSMYRIVDGVQYSAKAVREFEKAEAEKTAKAWRFTVLFAVSAFAVIVCASILQHKGWIAW